MDDKLIQRVEILYPIFLSYMAENGYATVSDSKAIVVKWYSFLEWLLGIGKELNDL